VITTYLNSVLAVVLVSIVLQSPHGRRLTGPAVGALIGTCSCVALALVRDRHIDQKCHDEQQQPLPGSTRTVLGPPHRACMQQNSVEQQQS
jgi:hypothetical protein